MKKARIDVLDIADAVEAVSEPLEVEEPHIDLQEESFLTQDEGKKSRWRVFFNWKLMLFAGLPLLGLAAGGFFLFTYLTTSAEKTAQAPTPAKKTAKLSPALPKPVSITYDNLAVVKNDLAGNRRVVMFSIAILPGRKAVPGLSSDRDVRMTAVKAVGGMLFPELQSQGGRDQLKKKIKSDIVALKGEDVVDEIWITSWTIL